MEEVREFAVMLNGISIDDDDAMVDGCPRWTLEEFFSEAQELSVVFAAAHLRVDFTRRNCPIEKAIY